MAALLSPTGPFTGCRATRHHDRDPLPPLPQEPPPTALSPMSAAAPTSDDEGHLVAEPASDGLDEAAERLLQVTLTAAEQLAERVAQARAHAAREAQALSGRQARESAARTEAERRVARAQLAFTRDPGWWDTAGRLQIADAYATARQWADLDPDAARDAARILQQVRERYGPNALPDLTATAASVQTARGGRQSAERAAQTEAELLIAADTRADTAARVHSWLKQHTDDLPADLTRQEVVEAVDSRLRADLFETATAIHATAGPSNSAQTASPRRPAGVRVNPALKRR
jgi:hypothetical protein